MKDNNIPQDIKEYVEKSNKKLLLKWILFTLLVAIVIQKDRALDLCCVAHSSFLIDEGLQAF